MGNRILFGLALAVSTVLAALTQALPSAQQPGDQFLDGIGETGLVARYVLESNPEDSSRNQFHATLRGGGGSFVEDAQFRRALLLTGDGTHLELPRTAIEGEDTLSFTAWLFLPTGASGPVFEFGSAANRLTARASSAGLRASVIVDGAARGEVPGKPLLENQWVHVAVVLDPAARVLTTYVDGARAGQASGVSVTATQLAPAGAANGLLIGKSHTPGDATLHARLRDVRIYRIALSDPAFVRMVLTCWSLSAMR